MSSRKPAASKGKTVTVKDATFGLLRAWGIKKVFGNPGSTELPFLSDWPDDIDYVLGLQEASVVGMADGYALATRNAGFVNLHSAAGVGNALGNIYNAYRNQTPMVITAGQQARSIMPLQAFLYAERASEFPRPYVKFAVEPARAEDVPAAIARAYYVAMQPPCGPTFVSVPIDDWAHATQPLDARQVSREIGPDAAAMQAAVASPEFAPIPEDNDRFATLRGVLLAMPNPVVPVREPTQDGPLIKRMSLLRRRPDLDAARFREEWFGFHAEAVSRDISIEQDELEDAGWFSRDEILTTWGEGGTHRLPRTDSISRRLIEDWLHG